MKKPFFRILTFIISLIVICFAYYSMYKEIEIEPAIILFFTILTLIFSLADFSKNQILTFILIILGLLIAPLIAILVKNGTYDIRDITIFSNSLTMFGLAFVLATLSIKNLKTKKHR